VTETDQKNIFNEWLTSHTALLFKVVRSYAPDPADRNDLFQEIIIQVWRSVPSFRQQSAVSTWLYRIALNTAIKWTRKEKRHTSESLELAQELLVEDTHADDRLAWLYEEIHKLDEIDRSLALLMLDDFSYKEMSAMLGISEANVGVKINRIKKRLITKSKSYERV
jgi:RNA polymerase sigma-70 factor (ECF subfamily)